nr:MAG TPA: ABC-type Fe3+ transport system, periplasmic binding protein [Bacteriophage sp.]
MKKRIYLVISILMLVSMSFPCAGISESSFASGAKTYLEHNEAMKGWKEELKTWFDTYKTRVDNGERLTDAEMELVFSYVDMAVDMSYILGYEGLIYTGYDYVSNNELRNITEEFKELCRAGLSQQKYLETVAMIFEK